MDYLDKLEGYLIKEVVHEVKKLTIEDDKGSFGDEAYESDAVPEKLPDEITASATRFVGKEPEGKKIRIKAEEVEDKTTGSRSSMFVWNSHKKCFIRRRGLSK